MSTGTETHRTVHLDLSDATETSTRQLASVKNTNQWRFDFMNDYEQLELFDLRPYTSEQVPVIEVEEQQVEEIFSSVEYEQLELDLFPQQPSVISILLTATAA